ncbi:MAG: TlpA family protein disulfide reductase [Planctomycetes bacterium]|nr:TlpA family protein disulfide reductase [Planctomycetota bacterium]
MMNRIVAIAGLAASLCAFSQTVPGSAQQAGAPAKIAGREVTLSDAAKAVLAKSASAYHALKTYRDQTEVETVFELKSASGKELRMPSRSSTRFAYAGPRRYTLRNESTAVYCYDQVFTNQIRSGRDDKGKPNEEKEITKLSPEGPVDWADAMGNLAAGMVPTPGQSLLMTGPGAGLELFISADEVTPGELDERSGVWVSGKGICPYSFGASGGGRDVVPIKAWFSDKTGLLREIRYDISRTNWALDAADSFGERNGGGGSVNAYVTVRVNGVAINEPTSDSLFVYSPDAPRGGKFEHEMTPGISMAPRKRDGAAPAGMTPAKPMGMTPAQPTGMAPAKPADAAAVNAEPGETISPADVMREAWMGKPAPAFTTKTVDDKNFALADLKGKVVLLDFWATWCGPCMQAIPSIQRLSEQFKDQPVAIVGMNRDKAGDESKVKRTIERKQLTFTQAMDTDGAIAKTFKISAIPAMILIDKQGVVRQIHVGYSPDEEKTLTQEIEALIKGDAIPAHK